MGGFNPAHLNEDLASIGAEHMADLNDNKVVEENTPSRLSFLYLKRKDCINLLFELKQNRTACVLTHKN
jgi:hypothetical protein